MATIQHNVLTTTNLHEPKDIAAASAQELYIADGSGSGDWTATQINQLMVLADVSTAETVYIPTPYAGTCIKVTSVLAGAITGANAIITPKNAAGSSMGTLTITMSGSAAGDVDTLAPASNNTFAADSFITVETDGASSTARKLWLTLTFIRT